MTEKPIPHRAPASVSPAPRQRIGKGRRRPGVPLKVLFLVPHPVEGPSVRLRVYQFVPYLEERGVRVAVRPFMSSAFLNIAFRPGRPVSKAVRFAFSTMRRFLDVAGAGRWDIVCVHRDAFPFGPPFLEAILRKLGPKLVFDFDDAIYVRSDCDRHSWDALKDTGKPAKVIRMADHVIVGNRILGEYARQFSAKVTEIPTVMDTSRYSPSPAPSPGGPTTVGWIGSPASAAYIKAMVPAFEELRRERAVRFRCVGIDPFPVNGLPVAFSPWSLDGEVDDLRAFDIGVMPLFETEVARAKCGAKLLQYMAMGMSTVSSPVGVNAEIIRDGENGLLARSAPEWVERLRSLVDDPAYRARLGAAGRATVEERYSVRVMAPRLLELFETVHAGG